MENLFLNASPQSLVWINVLFIFLMIWSLIWKGIALWKSARHNSKPWFVVLLIVNTLGILEILYIFIFSKKSEK
ncbi:MAG: DUF5652 family protein [Patescibacteria group bacterium]